LKLFTANKLTVKPLFTGSLLRASLEDQKYFAYLNERERVENNSFYKGVTKYDHIMVDEFQDINPLDLSLIKYISLRSRATMTLVGDDDQALFEWRAATPEYILNPEKYLSVSFSTYTLSVNYRSPANIVRMSQKLISLNTRREPKEIQPAKKEDAIIEVISTKGLEDELDKIYEIIDPLLKSADENKTVAILGRLKCQIIPYQIFLAANDIPFCAAEDLQVFLSDAFDKLISLLDIKARSEETRSKTSVASDMLSLCNLVLLYPLQKADEQKLRYFFLSKSFSSLLLAAEGMSQCELSVKTMNSGEIADRILKFINAETVSSTIKALAEGFESLQKHYAKAEDDIWHVDPPFASLGDFASRYGDRFDDFISDLIIAKDKLAVIPSDDDDSSEKWEIWKKPVHLMTAIRAKGKEFSTVVLLDVVDGVWPSKMAKSHVKKEAERRVFYVAVTRAKERMVMFVNRLFRGKPAVASQYIEELGLEWK